MLEHDGPFPVVEAGQYPPELVKVCQEWEVEPKELLGWSVSHVAVTLILPSGQKVGVSIRGEWTEDLTPGPFPEGKGSGEERPVAEDQPAAVEAPGSGEDQPAEEDKPAAKAKPAGRKKGK